jgi:ribosomal protein S18 acetylase RimI-like enzyme
LDSFLDVANERGNAFYLGRGFQRMREVHVYLAERQPKSEDPPALPRENLEGLALQPAHAAQVAELQEALFPGAYLTGEMLSRPAEGRKVFVLAEGERVLGYVCARADTVADEAPEGTVEFLGVQPAARRRGLGERLLRLALRWLFDAQGQAAVNLTVNDELANARALYEKVGFRLKYTGVHTRLER